MTGQERAAYYITIYYFSQVKYRLASAQKVTIIQSSPSVPGLHAANSLTGSGCPTNRALQRSQKVQFRSLIVFRDNPPILITKFSISGCQDKADALFFLNKGKRKLKLGRTSFVGSKTFFLNGGTLKPCDLIPTSIVLSLLFPLSIIPQEAVLLLA